MSNDERLEQLLRDMGKHEIKRPRELVAKTISRMHSASAPPRKSRLLHMNPITEAIGVFAAASIILFVGLLSGWAALNWWSGIGVTGIDLTQDPRIIEVQQQVPFNLALPTWIPRGYSLEAVQLFVSDSGDEYEVSLLFKGPRNSEPLAISQSQTMEAFFPADMQFVQIGPAEEGYFLGSDFTEWGAGTRSDLGYYFSSYRADGTLTGRSLSFIDTPDSDADRTYVTITSAIAPQLSRQPKAILTSEDMLNILIGITGADTAELIPHGDKIAQRTENWSLIKPTYIPPGFQYVGMNLSAKLINGYPVYSGTLEYTGANSDFIRIHQWAPDQPLGESQNAEAVELDNALAYYNWSYAQRLRFNTIAFNIEISANNAFAISKDDLIGIANSLTAQIQQAHASPSEVVNRFRVRPTTRNLSFSPDGSMVVGYVPALGDLAQLWLDGVRYDLPGSSHSDYGPVCWRGDKLVYHVINDYNEPEPGLFYVYNTRDHSYISFEGYIGLGNDKLKPVFLDDDTVAVVAGDGLWAYSIRTPSKPWSLLHSIDGAAEIKTLAWSPDAGKIAWVTATDAGDQLIVLDVAAGEQTLVYQEKEILDLAWSADSMQLAAISGNNTGILWAGVDVTVFAVNNFGSKLNWVPGKEILSFVEMQGLALYYFQDGEVVHTRILGGYRNHAWLANGNLAYVSDTVYTDDGEEMYEVTILGWR